MNTWLASAYALLPHLATTGVLFVHKTSRLPPGLPRATLRARVDTGHVEALTPALSAACGLPVNVLRRLASHVDESVGSEAALYLVEAAQPDGWQRPPAWNHALDTALAVLPETLRGGLAGWWAEREQQLAAGEGWQPPALRPAWMLPGWHAAARDWIADQLASAGERLVDLQPIRSWSISMVMRVTASRREMFFKASRRLPLFVNEGVVMRELARLYPSLVPRPSALDTGRGWLLMDDLGRPPGRDATLPQQAQLFESMARLQVDSCARTEALMALGIHDRRIPWLLSRLDALFAHEPTMRLLEPGERQALLAALPRLRAMLSELDALPIPPALVHGDLHAGNAAWVNGQPRIFDWTDTAISHPFFDLFEIFWDGEAAKREALAAAYLPAWQAHYPAAQTRRAFDLARVLYGLYHAVSYQVIVDHLESELEREELNGGYKFLRKVLAGLRQAD